MSLMSALSSSIHRLSLGARTNIALAFVLVGTLLLGVAGLVSVKESFKATLVKQQEVLIERTTDDIDQKLLRLLGALTASATMVTRETIATADTAQAFLDGNKALHSMFDRSLFLFSERGMLIAETPYLPGRRGLDGNFRDFVSETLRTGKPYISRPFVTTKDDKNAVLMIAVPVRDDGGRLIAILTGSLGLTQPGVLGNLQKAHIGKSGYFYLLSGDGVIIMHPDSRRVLERVGATKNELNERALNESFEGTEVTVNSRGVEMLTSLKRLHSVNWILGANFPTDEAFAPYHAFLIRWGMMSLACIVFALALQHFLVRRFTIRLQRFSTDLRGVAKVDGCIQPIRPQQDAELREVSNSFNELVERLNEREVALQLSMQARMADLQRFRLAMDASIDAIVLVNRTSMRVVEANATTCNMFGYTREELFHINPALLLGVTPGQLESVYDEVIAGRDTNPLAEPHVRHKDGSEVPVEVRRHAQRSGEDWIIVSVVRDVTERIKAAQQLRESERRFSDMLRNVELGSVMLDCEARITFCNEYLLRLTGWRYDEVIGKNWFEVFIPPDNDDLR